MEFPRHVYRKGRVDAYDIEQVVDADDMAAKLAAGWKATRDEALGKVAAVKVVEPEPAQDSAPTRVEMEQKARELGIKVDGRKSDKTLLAEIEQAIGG